MKDITIVPQDYIAIHTKTDTVIKKFDDGCEVYEIIEDRRPLVRCKDCKYFELDHFDRIDGIPLITAHEICTKWSGGSKTNKDGFCFMGERKGGEDE